MDLQKILDNAMTARRAEAMKDSPQLTLGEVILKMEAIADKSKRIIFDFTSNDVTQVPGSFYSWRGSYEELSVSNENFSTPNAVTVHGFLKKLKEAVGQNYTGYKGGDFRMGRTTPIWVAGYGDCGLNGYKESDDYLTIAITDIEDGTVVATIITKALEY